MLSLGYLLRSLALVTVILIGGAVTSFSRRQVGAGVLCIVLLVLVAIYGTYLNQRRRKVTR